MRRFAPVFPAYTRVRAYMLMWKFTWKPICHHQSIWSLGVKAEGKNKSLAAKPMWGGEAYPARASCLYLLHFEAAPNPSSFSHMEANSRQRKAKKDPFMYSKRFYPMILTVATHRSHLGKFKLRSGLYPKSWVNWSHVPWIWGALKFPQVWCGLKILKLLFFCIL